LAGINQQRVAPAIIGDVARGLQEDDGLSVRRDAGVGGVAEVEIVGGG
jgi:hypothetical protein